MRTWVTIGARVVPVAPPSPTCVVRGGFECNFSWEVTLVNPMVLITPILIVEVVVVHWVDVWTVHVWVSRKLYATRISSPTKFPSTECVPRMVPLLMMGSIRVILDIQGSDNSTEYQAYLSP